MQKLNYLFYWIFRLIASIPLKFFFFISPLFYFLIYHIVGYRKKIVFTNLRNSFPEKNDEEIKKLAKKFYWHLVDLIFENIKLFHYNKRQIDKHFTIKNPEILDDDYHHGRSAILVSGHYNNWEMMVGIRDEIKHHRLAIYHPLQNKFIDRILFKNRNKNNTEPVPMLNYLRRLMECINSNILTVSWFIADQTAPPETPFWTNFLNQDTPFFMGAEKTARKFNLPIYFMHIQKVKRGVYEAVFTKLFDQPKDEPEYAITEKIVRIMEEEILNDPQYWLWSHRRWKHRRPENHKKLS